MRFIRDDARISGPVNMSAPGVVENRGLMRALRRVVGMPIGLPSWRFMLEPAMWVLRAEPDLVLNSRWIAPGVLEDAGYAFAFPELESALRDVREKDSRTAPSSSG